MQTSGVACSALGVAETRRKAHARLSDGRSPRLHAEEFVVELRQPLAVEAYVCAMRERSFKRLRRWPEATAGEGGGVAKLPGKNKGGELDGRRRAGHRGSTALCEREAPRGQGGAAQVTQREVRLRGAALEQGTRLGRRTLRAKDAERARNDRYCTRSHERASAHRGSWGRAMSFAK
eukprot:1277727-Pleurochrysis_carterae.AAC.1